MAVSLTNAHTLLLHWHRRNSTLPNFTSAWDKNSTYFVPTSALRGALEGLTRLGDNPTMTCSCGAPYSVLRYFSDTPETRGRSSRRRVEYNVCSRMWKVRAYKSDHSVCRESVHVALPKPVEINQLGSRSSLLVKHRTRDRKVASSKPGRSGGRIFFLHS